MSEFGEKGAQWEWKTFINFVGITKGEGELFVVGLSSTLFLALDDLFIGFFHRHSEKF